MNIMSLDYEDRHKLVSSISGFCSTSDLCTDNVESSLSAIKVGNAKTS
jgi:hypothetical protein